MKILATVCMGVSLLTLACSAAAQSQKHGEYDISVTSIERVTDWEDPTNRNMRYRANPDGAIMLVKISIKTPNGSVGLGESEIKDTTGKTYKSPRDSYHLYAAKAEPGTDSVTLPFILPAAADVTTLTLERRRSTFPSLQPRRKPRSSVANERPNKTLQPTSGA